MESNQRTFVKTISWRILATIITFSVAYFMTSTQSGMSNAKLAALIGLMDTTLKFGVYYTHERVWNKIDYGREIRRKASDFEI